MNVQWKVYPGDVSNEDECYRIWYIAHYSTQSKRRNTVSSSQDNSPTRVAAQIQRKCCQKQLKHLPLSTTARRIPMLSFYRSKVPSVSKKPSSHSKSSSKRNTADWMSAIPAKENGTRTTQLRCVIAWLLEINLKTNTQHLPSICKLHALSRLWRLDAPLIRPVNPPSS